MISLVLDASVVVKWFKEGELLEEEAQRVRQDVLSSTLEAFSSELLNLEVCRGLVKAGYPSKKIEEAYAVLHEMNELGFIELVPTAMIKQLTKQFVIELKLYVSDALILAAAQSKSSHLLTEDRHLLRQDVKKKMKESGLKLFGLKELYGAAK